MPFPRHVIEPRYVCQGLLSQSEDKQPTLQEFSNHTLVNFIRQLATLSTHVDSIFGRLLSESEDFMQRLKELQTRITNAEEKAKNLDSMKENIGSGFGKDKKAVYKKIVERQNFFQAERRLDTGIFMENDRPQEVSSLHSVAEAMPRLHELDEYREDGKDCAKIYSNPDLFFLAWQDSLQKMIAEQQGKSDMKAKSTVRQTRLRRVRKAKASRIIDAQKFKMGVELVPDNKKRDEEEDEYFTEGEWSSSDDEVMMPNGSANPTFGSGRDPTLRVPSSTTENSKHLRLSSFREYNFNDIDLPAPTDELEPHSPPVSVESLKLSEDLPPPPPMLEMDYSGVSADYDIQSALDTMSAVRWTDDT